MRSDIEFLIIYCCAFFLGGLLIGLSIVSSRQHQREKRAFRDGFAQGILDATSGQPYFRRVK